MNEIFSKAIKDSEILRKSEVPWKTDEPFPQPYHVFDSLISSWISKTPSDQSAKLSEVTTIAIYTWNIDFMLPFGEARMKAALDYLGGMIEDLASKPSVVPVIFLQECTPEDLVAISATRWVRDRFILTDIDATHWATNHYGTTILLDARPPPASLFRVHYSETRMDRDAFFIDVPITSGRERKVVRLCNSHLESLAMEPPLRPAQVRLIAGFLHAEGLLGGLAAGDFNAIQPFDRTLHSDNGLKDAFLERGARKTARRAIPGATRPQPSSESSLAVRGWTRSISVARSSCLSSQDSARTFYFQRVRVMTRRSLNRGTRL